MQGWMDGALRVRLRAGGPLPAGLQHHYIVVPRLDAAASYILLSAVSDNDQADITYNSTMQGWMDEALSVRLRADEPLPAGLQHNYIVVAPERKLAVLCRQIRADLLA